MSSTNNGSTMAQAAKQAAKSTRRSYTVRGREVDVDENGKRKMVVAASVTFAVDHADRTEPDLTHDECLALLATGKLADVELDIVKPWRQGASTGGKDTQSKVKPVMTGAEFIGWLTANNFLPETRANG